MSLKKTTWVALTFALLGGITWQILFQHNTANAADVALPYTVADNVTRGEELYIELCASCHGVNLEGAAHWRQRGEDGLMPAPPHDETGHTWHHPDAVLFAITKFGSAKVVGQGYQSNMPGFEDSLSDQEILNVLAYIKSTWPLRVIETHNQINSQSQP